MVSVGIISDIHANFFALEIALEFLNDKLDALICAGDFVGYGFQPTECLEAILDFSLPTYYCLGNHDVGVRYEYCNVNGLENCTNDLKFFQHNEIRPAAKTMFLSNAQDISEDHYQFLRDLPLTTEFRLGRKSFHLTHGTPSKRQKDNITRYLPAPPIQPLRQTIDRAQEFSGTKDIDIIIVGHTHQRFYINRDRIQGWSHIGDRYNNKQVEYPREFDFPRDKIILNPGAIGQPRDGNANASFAVLNLETNKLSFHALQYSRDKFYEIAKQKCPPSIQDGSFWEITF
ncbi:MAG: metallophosphoesterase family protein [Candidatus Hodarchaeales archaeon]|jgi:predicted phosphodiesterase